MESESFGNWRVHTFGVLSLLPSYVPAVEILPMKNIIIYTIHPDEWPCEYCDKAKAWLSERGLRFFEYPHYTETRERFYDQWGLTGKSRTMPQIFIDGVRIGGFSELVEMEDL